MKRINGFIFLWCLLVFFISCSPIPKNLRNLEDRSLTFEEVLKNPDAYKGKIVIWGGEIIETLTRMDHMTLIEVSQEPLNGLKEPKVAKESGGRFLALTEKVLDPHIYRKGRAITVVGKITGVKKRLFGELEYSYPLLLGEEIYLWRIHWSPSSPSYKDYYFPEYPWGDYAYDGPRRYYDSRG